MSRPSATWTSFRQWTWELPQTLLGFIIMALLAVFSTVDKGRAHLLTGQVIVVRTFAPIFVSLGRYVIVNHLVGHKTRHHEYGHCMQSAKLGPLYLIIVGVPSFTMAVISRFSKRFAANYYNRFPENWADRLGGVRREK